MSKSKAIDYQEILENLQARLIELYQRRSMNDPFHRHMIDFEIEHIEKQISVLRKEIFFQNHPNLQKYRIHIEEFPLLIAYFLAEVGTIWIYMIVLSANPNLEIIYRILCVVCAPIFLFFGVRQYRKLVNRLNEQAKLQIEFEYPKLFLEIENNVSLLNSEGNNG